jgi:hypothetical protein
MVKGCLKLSNWAAKSIYTISKAKQKTMARLPLASIKSREVPVSSVLKLSGNSLSMIFCISLMASPSATLAAGLAEIVADT